MKKTASIIDFIYPGLDTNVWGEDGNLLPEHKKLIEDTIVNTIREEGLQDYDEWIEQVKIIGGITTYRYTFDSDIDVHIRVDLPKFIASNNPGFSEQEAHDYLDNLRKKMNEAKTTLSGTQHPVEYFFETPFVNKEGSPGSGLYDVVNETWEIAPISIDKDFDIEEVNQAVVEIANTIADEIEIGLGRMDRHVRRIEELQAVIKAWDSEQQKKFEVKLQTKLQEIEDEIKKQMQLVDQITKDRRNYSPEGDDEIKFKYLQKFGYLAIINELKVFIEDDGKITEDEIPEIKKVLDEACLGLSKIDKKSETLEVHSGDYFKGYWIEPNGTEHELGPDQEHTDWLNDNNISDGMTELIDMGWIRVRIYGPDASLELNDLSHIPESLDNFFAKHTFDTIVLENIDREISVTVKYEDAIAKGLQRAVNKSLQLNRLQEAKKGLSMIHRLAVGDYRSDIEQILKLTQDNGGATWNFTNGSLVGTEAYSVSTHLDRTKTLPANELTAETLSAYISDNHDLLNDSNNSLGTWNDNGTLYLDVVTTLEDREQAIALGKKHNQKAIFDLKNLEEIPTGGTGEIQSSKKTAFTLNGYWLAPDGTPYDVRDGKSQSHANWVWKNQKLLIKLGFSKEYFNTKQRDFDYITIAREMLEKGWVRVGDLRGHYGAEVANIRKIPENLENFLPTVMNDGNVIVVADLDKTAVEVEYPWNSLQKAVNQSFRKRRFAGKTLGLSKNSFLEHAYWVDPNGRSFEVRNATSNTSMHSDWIKNNMELLETEYNIPVSTSDRQVEKGITQIMISMYDAGWVRIGDGDLHSWSVTLKDIRHIPSSVESILEGFLEEDSSVFIEDYQVENSVEVWYPWKSLQQEVNKALTHSKVNAAIKQDKILYHATYKPLLAQIRREGLRPPVYLSSDRDQAESFAEVPVTTGGDEKDIPDEWLDQIVVLAVDAFQLEKAELEVDPYYRSKESPTFVYYDVIPIQLLKKADFSPSISTHAPTNKWNPNSDQEIPLDPDSVSDEETWEGGEVADKPRRNIWRTLLDMFLDNKDVDKEASPPPVSDYKQHHIKPLGVTEFLEFYEVAPQEAQDEVDDLLDQDKNKEAWVLMEKYLGRSHLKLGKKIAAIDKKYWVANDGEYYEVTYTHLNWITQNSDLLRDRYHIKETTPNRIYGELFGQGWARVGDSGYGDGYAIEVDNIHKISPVIQNFIGSLGDENVLIEDSSGDFVLIDTFEKDIQRAIDRAFAKELETHDSVDVAAESPPKHNTTWDTPKGDNEPFSPLPTTFKKDIDEKNLNWRHPWKYMGRPKGPNYSNEREVIKFLEDMPMSKRDKKASGDPHGWLAPDGQFYAVDGIHLNWISENRDIVKKYGFDLTKLEEADKSEERYYAVDEALHDIWDEMFYAGWVRINDNAGGTSNYIIHLDNLRNIPSHLDDFIAQNNPGKELIVADNKRDHVRIDDPFPTLQKAVNKALQQKRLIPAKKASFDDREAYWISPEGEINELTPGEEHWDWLHGHNETEQGTDEFWRTAIQEGWIRAIRSDGDLLFELQDMKNLPEFLEKFVIDRPGSGRDIYIEDHSGNGSARFLYDTIIEDGLQKAVNKSLQQKRLVPASKKASVTTVDVGGHEARVFENPTSQQAVNLYNKSKDKKLRFFVSPDNKMYIWDAYDAIHKQVIEALGYDYEEIFKLFWENRVENMGFLEGESQVINIEDLTKVPVTAKQASIDLLENWDYVLSGKLTPDVVYRGMSDEEYTNYKSTGFIEGGSSPEDQDQEGMTFFTIDPEQAKYYGPNIIKIPYSKEMIPHSNRGEFYVDGGLQVTASTYTSDEMEKIYVDQHEMADDPGQGGGHTPRDFNNSTTDYPKPEDLERPKVHLDRWHDTDLPIPSYEVTWYLGQPKGDDTN